LGLERGTSNDGDRREHGQAEPVSAKKAEQHPNRSD
jgi:hypothetical protein